MGEPNKHKTKLLMFNSGEKKAAANIGAWIPSQGIELLKETKHNKSLCECHEFRFGFYAYFFRSSCNAFPYASFLLPIAIFYAYHIIVQIIVTTASPCYVRSLLLPYILFLLCMHFSNMIKMVRIFVSFDKFDQGKISFWIGVNWSCAKSIIELLTSRTYHSTLIQL